MHLHEFFYGLSRCPVCRTRPSSALGCCAACGEALFEPTVSGTTLALGAYEGGLERAVRALKFHHTTRLAKLFGARLAEAVTLEGWRVHVVCAVPLHASRRLERGYNQAELVAKETARCLGRPYKPLLKRVRATGQQARLAAGERGENVSDAFSASPCRGARVLLVDDVVTSGATTTECSLALLDAGVSFVYVAAVARAVTKTVTKAKRA